MNARQIAATVLKRAQQREAFAAELLDDAFRNLPFGEDSGFRSSDRRLATQLVMGVIRRRATLDAFIAPLLSKPFEQIHPDTLDVLRLGAYQLVFLTQVPPHAAVNETVELLPTNRGSVRNFANAMLRQISEIVRDDYDTEPRTFAVPIDDGRYRLLGAPIFPDPQRAPTEYLAAAFSWPMWLAELWCQRHGFRECLRLGFWFNAPPTMWLRVNSILNTRDRYLAKLRAEEIAADVGEHPHAIQLLEGFSVRSLPGYESGQFAVQDHSSMLVASALNPEPGWNVLDLCAAPGGKTTHLAELMNNRGRIVACDIEAQRLQTVTALCQRLGISIVETALLNETTPAPRGLFDAALVDVPCSNTGVLGRRAEVRWRLQPNEFSHLIRLQMRLLNDALARVKPGGVVVYSTCSIEPDENRGVVNAVLQQNADVLLERDAIAIPGSPSDGGYWARLRKR